MDLANQLFNFTLGVEPNKDTMQRIAGTLNSAVLSLSDKQKALSDYADTIEPSAFLLNQNANPADHPALSKQQIQYIQAAPTPQAAKARKAKVLRDPVVWQITEKQMRELRWKQKQLLSAQKAELERKKKERARRGPPPKLGPKKNGNGNGNGNGAKSPAKAPAPQQNKPKTPKTPAKQPAKGPAPKMNGVPKAPGKGRG